MEPVDIFVGYDPREPAAYHVFCHSVLQRASVPVAFHPVRLEAIKEYRESHDDGSNAFIYSRFLVPSLMGHRGWALWADGDMLCRADIAELWALRDLYMAVQCVQHAYKTHAPRKYLGSPNNDYLCKNWSSLMLINCAHMAWRQMTPQRIEKMTGEELHRFKFIPRDRVGQLPPEWNWLANELPYHPEAKLVHFTIGTPGFTEYSDCDYANEWHNASSQVIYCGREPCKPDVLIAA